MEALFADYMDRVSDAFLNPQKRVFLGYLAAAFVLAAAFLFLTRVRSFKGTLRVLFHRRVWWSPSAKADYKILLINQAVMMGVGPRLLGKLTLATLVFEGLHVWFDGRTVLFPEAPAWAIALSFTSAVFLLDDATKYILHRALHRWPLLWAFHKVHHSAETLSPFTVYRTHPVEGVLFALRATLVQALIIAVFIYFFGDRASLLTILGANGFLFVFNALGSNLRHSHVWLRYGRVLEHIFISPAQHQIHHSVKSEHHDRNFGTVLAIWDWMGGSLVLADRKKTFRLGLGEGAPADHRLTALYLTPFRDAWGSIPRLRPVKAIKRLREQLA